MSGAISESTPKQLRPSDLVVLEKLGDFDVLETFKCLGLEEQERFLVWVAQGSDEGSRFRRADALVMVMRKPWPASN